MPGAKGPPDRVHWTQCWRQTWRPASATPAKPTANRCQQSQRCFTALQAETTSASHADKLPTFRHRAPIMLLPKHRNSIPPPPSQGGARSSATMSRGKVDFANSPSPSSGMARGNARGSSCVRACARTSLVLPPSVLSRKCKLTSSARQSTHTHTRCQRIPDEAAASAELRGNYVVVPCGGCGATFDFKLAHMGASSVRTILEHRCNMLPGTPCQASEALTLLCKSLEAIGCA